jgi:hypothetical protein
MIFGAFSCNKNPEKIGDNLQPDRNQIQLLKTDTTTIVAYSVIDDSIRTDEASNMLLGSIKDPVFGTVVAGFYTQVRLSTNGHSFGTNPQLDSLVLQMAYSNYYGDTTTLQTLQVFELEEDLDVPNKQVVLIMPITVFIHTPTHPLFSEKIPSPRPFVFD